MKHAVGIVMAIAALSTAACTTSHVDNPTVTTPASSTVVTGPGIDSCLLTTPDQLKEVYGGTVTAVPRTGGTAPAGCSWTVTGSRLGIPAFAVSLYARPASLRPVFDADAAATGGVAVQGVGVGAYWEPRLAALEVLTSAQELTVMVSFPGGTHPQGAGVRADAIALAQLVLPALPK